MMNPDSDDQNIPGLDDLLNSIRGESERDNSSALAVYVPDQREEDLVSEEIDERILALLGLEDVVDIDYATYKTLLREKMMEGRAASSKIPSEETEILTNEFKRVKRNTGRFKVKKEKIKFDSFVDNIRPQQSAQQPRPQQSLLALPGTVEPPAEVEEKEEKIDGIQKFLGGISEKLAEIEKNLGDMLDMEAKEAAAEKKEVAKERVDAEKVKKRDKESKLESGVKGFAKKMTDTVTKPVKGFFESILNFFMQIFLGSVVQQLIKYLENPMMIFNPFIKMINFVIGLLNNVLNFVFGGLIGPINTIGGFINSGIELLENSVNGIMGLFGQKEEEETKLPRIPEAKVPQIPMIPLFQPKEEKKEEPVQGLAGGGMVINGGPTFNVTQEVSGYEGGGQIPNIPNIKVGNIGGWKGGNMSVSPRVSGFKGGGEVKPTYNFLSPVTNFGYEGGGSITSSSGQTISGMGADTQLIAAQPGEIVMSKKAVQAYGANNLLAMNKNAGGTNIPTMGSVQGFQGGGQVGATSLVIGAGHSPSEENAMKGIPKGADGINVQGTQDFKTGVNEWEAARHVVGALKQLVPANNLQHLISFQNITTYKGPTGLQGLPKAVEAAQGTQFVDIHFDARGGRGGVLNPPTSGISPIDRSMMAIFGEYPGVPPEAKGVTAVGGTILEVAAIDDPAIAQFLGEVKTKKMGPETMNLATKILNSMLPGLGAQAAQQNQQTQQTQLNQQENPQAPMSPGTQPEVKPFTQVAGVDPVNFSVFSSMSEGQRSRVLAAQPGDVLGDGTRVTPRMQHEMQKFEVGLAQHKKAVAAAASSQPSSQPSVTPSQPTITPATTPQNLPPPSIQAQQPSIITLPNGQQVQAPNTSGSMAGQKSVPAIGSRDLNNTEFLVIKSIYNIVG